jgi:hypothetical protein
VSKFRPKGIDKRDVFCIIKPINISLLERKTNNMTKQQEIRELEQRLGREIALEYFKNEKRVVSEEQAELEDYKDLQLGDE